MTLLNRFCFLVALMAYSAVAAGQSPSTSPATRPAGPVPWKLLTAEESGLGKIDPVLKWPWISSAVDIDGDGDLDFNVHGHHGAPTDPQGGYGIWYYNDGKGRFTPSKDRSGWKDLGTIEGWWMDLNSDGRVDCIGYEAAWGKWFINDGKGQLGSVGKVMCSAPVDADGDGLFQEFHVGGRGSGASKTQPAGLYALEPGLAKWDGKSVPSPKLLWTWEDLGVQRLDGLPADLTSVTLNVRSCVDLNGDGINDLIVWRVLFEFRELKYSDVTTRTWVLLGRKGQKPELANAKLGLPDEGRHALYPMDVDRDGDLDLVDVHEGSIWLNEGATFARSAKRLFPADESWKHKVFAGDGEVWPIDPDNSGRRGLYIGNSHGYPTAQKAGLFIPDDSGSFQRTLPEWASAGKRSFFYICPADFDNDGDLDVAVIVGEKELRYYRNEGRAGMHWVRVRPAPKARFNGALGCKLWVYRAGGMGKPTDLLHYAQAYLDTPRSRTVPTVMHAGLGEAGTVDIRLTFPSGKTVERAGVKADQLLEIAEE